MKLVTFTFVLMVWDQSSWGPVYFPKFWAHCTHIMAPQFMPCSVCWDGVWVHYICRASTQAWTLMQIYLKKWT